MGVEVDAVRGDDDELEGDEEAEEEEDAGVT